MSLLIEPNRPGAFRSLEKSRAEPRREPNCRAGAGGRALKQREAAGPPKQVNAAAVCLPEGAGLGASSPAGAAALEAAKAAAALSPSRPAFYLADWRRGGEGGLSPAPQRHLAGRLFSLQPARLLCPLPRSPQQPRCWVAPSPPGQVSAAATSGEIFDRDPLSKGTAVVPGEYRAPGPEGSLQLTPLSLKLPRRFLLLRAKPRSPPKNLARLTLASGTRAPSHAPQTPGEPWGAP